MRAFVSVVSLLMVTLHAGATTIFGARGAPAQDLIPSRYVSYMTTPWPNGCHHRPTISADFFSQYRISTNPYDDFLGNVSACIYRAGHFPMYTKMGPGGNCADGNWNCSRAVAIYGGIPQLTNLTSHLLALQADIERDFPDPDFSGVAAVDWEAWKPNFKDNQLDRAEYWIYVNRSIELAAQRHPHLTGDALVQVAEQEFNNASHAFWLGSLRLMKKLRPKAQWGFYGLGGFGWEDMDWLYDEVTAFYPSIYVPGGWTLEKYQNYVSYHLNNTRRARARVAERTGNPLLPIYTYTWAFVDQTPYHSEYLTPEFAQASFVAPALDFGLAGTIIWGSSLDSDNTTVCGPLGAPGSMLTYFNTTLGPMLKGAAEAADSCALQRCSGHGRCWGSAACDCDGGYSGNQCDQQLHRAD